MLAKPHETAVNGDAGPSDPSQRKRPPRLRKAVVRSVQSKLEAVLEIISSTVGVARNLFVGSSGQKPLLADVLSFIQADPVPLTGDLPSDLRLTTPVLLSTLPSSGHFTQLPPNIKSYRPYIDDGVISTLSGDSLSNKLRQWFSKASEDIKQALGKWLSDLHTVTEIWTFRAAILRWSSSADGLEEYEKTSLVTILDEACLKQASAVWKDTLDSATAEFRDLLSCALGELRDSTPTSLLGNFHPIIHYILYKHNQHHRCIPGSIPFPSSVSNVSQSSRFQVFLLAGKFQHIPERLETAHFLPDATVRWGCDICRT